MTRERRLWLDRLTVACVGLLAVWSLLPAAGMSLGGRAADSEGLEQGTSSRDGSTSSASTATTAPGGAGATSTSGADGGSSSTVAPGALQASDVGVTAKEITIGVGLIDLGGLASAGFGVGLRGDEKQVAAALVDDVNRRGGINGRTLRAHVYNVDPLDERKARAACLQATEQDKVFAYVDTLSQYSAAQQACLSTEHGVPLITPTPLSADVQAQAFPNQISPIQNDNRAVIGAVRLASAQGFFGAGPRVGIIDDTCSPSVNEDLKRALREAGIGEGVSEFTFDCDGNNVASQATQAALAHKRDRVTHVVVATQYVQLQLYATAAATQLFAPRYLVSDLGGLTADVSVESMDPSQFDRAMGITSSFSGSAAIGHPLSAMAESCNRALVDHGLPPMRNVTGADGLAAYLCETLTLFERLATLAGPHLTRAALTSALPSVGAFRGAFTDTAVFDRVGKTSGGDTLAVIEWRRGCTCYHQIVPHRPAGI